MTEKPFSLGVLFVHGIGAQARGETLASFGGPFCKWLEYRCAALAESHERVPADVGVLARRQEQLEAADWTDPVLPPTLDRPPDDSSGTLHRVVLRETTLQDHTDSAAPAHTKIALLSIARSEELSVEHWLLAESNWAGTFAPPSFGDLARWGFAVLPWIVGSHFGAQVKRRLHERAELSSKPASTPAHDRIWAITRWTWRLTAAIGAFGLGLLSTLLTMPLLALVLALGLIPIPKLRSALLGIQLRLAATVGDAFVLLVRPIEAASIVGAVRRDLHWMASKCSEVVVVAHSQGGAVAHLALRGTIPSELKLLFTFGSGLRKLEEARELMRTPASFGLSAVATSIALFFLLSGTTSLLVGAVPQSESAGVVVWVFGSGLLLVAGIRDHLRGIPLPELDRWIKWLESRGPSWKDCYATGDPVPNGSASDAAKDRSLEVCNRSSMISDHTTYWSNLDEFASVLYAEISASRKKDPVPDLRIDSAQLKRVASRRRWRVAVGRCIEWVAAVGVFAVTVHRWPAVQAFLLWAWSRTGAPIVEAILGIQPPFTADHTIDWTTVGLLALILGALLLVRSLWSAWDLNEMRRSIGLRVERRDGRIFIALTFLVIITMHIVWYTTDLSFPLFMLSFVPMFVFVVLKPNLYDRARREPSVPAAPAAATHDTSVGTLVSTAIGLGMAAALPFGLGLAGWDALIWLTERTLPAGDTVLGFHLGDIPSEAVGGAAVLVAAAAWTLPSMRRKPQPAGSTQ